MTQLIQTMKNFPTLNTVLIVEETLKKAGEVITLAELKRRLPKKIMHQTLMAVLNYLDHNGKIIFYDSKILWAFKERKGLNKLIKRGIEL